MRGKGVGLITLGLAFLLTAAALAGYNLLESRQAKTASAQTVQNIKLRMDDLGPRTEETASQILDTVPVGPKLPDFVRFPEMQMPVVTVEGQEYIGLVEIPCLNLELPVMAQWSYPALKIAPCRYEGSAYLGNLIVIAHNYDSHFGTLKDLRPEDVVFFTDGAGNVFRYRVIELEILPGNAVEDMSSGDWDLTLFTCTYGGRSRVTVRCELLETVPAEPTN
jgi:sortase A